MFGNHTEFFILSICFSQATPCGSGGRCGNSSASCRRQKVEAQVGSCASPVTGQAQQTAQGCGCMHLKTTQTFLPALRQAKSPQQAQQPLQPQTAPMQQLWLRRQCSSSKGVMSTICRRNASAVSLISATGGSLAMSNGMQSFLLPSPFASHCFTVSPSIA